MDNPNKLTYKPRKPWRLYATLGNFHSWMSAWKKSIKEAK